MELILFCCGFILFLIILVCIVVPPFFIVQQQNVAVVERFGKFSRCCGPGLHLKIPIVERVAGRVSLRVNQLNVKTETKTSDNVFVHVMVSVQYLVIPEKVYDAYYKLVSPEIQINSYVFDVVRARVPTMKLDELFEKKDEIAVAVKNELNDTMNQFGFNILNALVTDIEPDAKVKSAMNEINAAQRLRIATQEKAEAEWILKVKAAEAEAKSKALQGQGIADQRKAIIEGLKSSVEEFSKDVSGATAQDVMNLVLLTQYFDTLKEIGQNSNTILIPHSPSGLSDIAEQLRNSIIIGNEVSRRQNLNLEKNKDNN